MRSVINSSIQLSLRHAKKVYLVMAAIAVFALIQFPRINIDTDPENMLPADNQARVFHNQTKQVFDLHDAIVVGAVASGGEPNKANIFTPKELRNVKLLTDFIMNLEGVVSKDVMSLSQVDNITQQVLEDGSQAIRFEWMMSEAPKNNENANLIHEQIQNLPLLRGTVASQGGDAIAIYVPIEDKNKSYAISSIIKEKISSYDTEVTWHITGLPVAEDQFGYEMFVQMGISAPLAGLAIFVLLFMMFRDWRFISAAMVVAMFTVVVTMGALIGLGYTVHIMSSMIAIFLMPIAVVDSVHIMSEFADRYKAGEDKREVASSVVKTLFKPMMFTSVTSTVGFLSLLLTPIPPVQIFGAFIGFGILLAFVTTIVFVPAYLSRIPDATLLKLQKLHQASLTSESGLVKLVSTIGRIARKRQGLHLLLFVGVFVWSMVGISKIQINDNPVRWFKESHPIRVADSALNQSFAGTYNAYLVLTDSSPIPSLEAILEDGKSSMTPMPPSLQEWQQAAFGLQGDKAERLNGLIYWIEDKLFEEVSPAEQQWLEAKLVLTEAVIKQQKRFMQPDVLAYIDALQIHMESTGLVGKSNSLADIVKVVNRELRSGDESDYVIPQSSNAVAQTLMQYQSSHRPGDLWHFVSQDYVSSLVWLQLTSGDNQHMTRLVDNINQYVAANPLPQGITLDWAGKAYLNVVWQEQMVSGMLDSLISAFVIVFVMMVLLFRSIVFGLLAMLPLSLTISFIYGLIGWLGKDYDMPIAVLSALTLGLSVDFAIHFLERARAAFKETRSVKDTLDIMFGEPANAISKNALVVALGFTPLLFAPLMPYVTVGVFLASIMLISALVTLIMLPALMKLGQDVVFSQSSVQHSDNTNNDA